MHIPIWYDCFKNSMQSYYFCTNNWVNFSMGSVFFMGKKWALFVKWSTTTHRELFLDEVLGNQISKSIEISSHFHSRIGSSYNSPMGLWCSALTTLHTEHLFTHLATSLFMPSHQKCCFKPWYIFVLLGWAVYGVWWASANIFSLILGSFGITFWFW